MSERQFADRRDAGQSLAARLKDYADQDNTVVLALPRGGVPVAYQVAAALHLPLDVLIVRKVGAPGNPELAMGAIASGGVEVINDSVTSAWGVSDDRFSSAAQQEWSELQRREKLYRRGREPLAVAGKTVILIDDGVATGSTMKAAVAALRKLDAREIIIGVPVGADQTLAELHQQADQVICLQTPAMFYAVGQVYRDFSQTSDDEVRQLLDKAAQNLNTTTQ